MNEGIPINGTFGLQLRIDGSFSLFLSFYPHHSLLRTGNRWPRWDTMVAAALAKGFLGRSLIAIIPSQNPSALDDEHESSTTPQNRASDRQGQPFHSYPRWSGETLHST